MSPGWAETSDPLVTMPLAVEINGEGLGEVPVEATRDLSLVRVDMESVSALVQEQGLTETLVIPPLPTGWAALTSLESSGLDVELDLERLVIVFLFEDKAPPPVGPQTLSFRGQGPRFEGEYLEEATWSGYNNIRVRQRYVHEAMHEDTGRQPYTADLDHVLNYRGLALEAGSLLREDPPREESNFFLEDVRLTYDDPARLLRWRVGEIASPITTFQRGLRVVGASVGREFRLQPYENFSPTGTAQFELTSAASVEVLVNGQLVRVLQLEPGLYNVEDFQLVTGTNSILLRIIEVSGRIEEVVIDVFGSSRLLRAGYSAFAVTVGYPESLNPDVGTTTLFDQSWVMKVYEREPAASGFWQYGFSENLTGEVSVQAASYWQRVGVGVDWGTDWGLFSPSLSFNRPDSTDPGYAAELKWEHRFWKQPISWSSTYTSEDFTRIGAEGELRNDLAWNHRLSSSHRLPQDLNLSVSAFYQDRRWSDDAWGLGVRLSRVFRQGHGSLLLQSRRAAGETSYGAYVNLSLRLGNNTRVVAGLGGGGSGVVPPNRVEVRYQSYEGDRFLRMEGGVIEDDGAFEAFGRVHHRGAFWDAQLRNNLVYDDVVENEVLLHESVLELGLGVAFADGVWALGPPVRDSFLILTSHELWRDAEVSVEGAGYRGGEKHQRYPTLVDGLREYYESNLNLQVVDDPRFLEDGDLYVRPSYRRGTKFEVGSDAIYLIRGTLLGADGEPLQHAALILLHEDGTRVQSFTNVAGRFAAGPMKPGRWKIRAVQQGLESEVEVTGSELFISLGEIELGEPEPAS